MNLSSTSPAEGSGIYREIDNLHHIGLIGPTSTNWHPSTKNWDWRSPALPAPLSAVAGCATTASWGW